MRIVGQIQFWRGCKIYRCYYPLRSRDSMSPVFGIFPIGGISTGRVSEATPPSISLTRNQGSTFLPEFTWFYLNLPEFSWIYLNLPEFTWIYLNLSEFTWIYLNLPKFTWIYLNLPECVHLCSLGFTWVFLGSLGLIWFDLRDLE